ncbi:hypothetical protein [Streptosporangium vulgare]|uniref:hypothetical protein n=1 Tax=Streptosporangium vulgare TaxID=46190 RepID=UPI0031D5852C
MAVLHGLTAGRAPAEWVTWSYVVCLVAVGAALLIRVISELQPKPIVVREEMPVEVPVAARPDPAPRASRAAHEHRRPHPARGARGPAAASPYRRCRMIPYRVPPVRQLGPARLTAGLEDCRRMDLAEHRDMHGTAPSMSGEELAALADEVDMRGRGGAAFPFARKVRAVMDKKADKVVLVNAAEGEPASSKDTMLLTRTPHLVIEGALLAAGAIGAKQVVIATVEGGMGQASVAAAVEERGISAQVRVVGIVERFISGEGGALVRSVNGLVGEPPGRKVRAVESGCERAAHPAVQRRDVRPARGPRDPGRGAVRRRRHGARARDGPAHRGRLRQGPGRGRGRDRHPAVRRPGRLPGLHRRRGCWSAATTARGCTRTRRPWRPSPGRASRRRAASSAPGSSCRSAGRPARWARRSGSRSTWPPSRPGSADPAVSASRTSRSRWPSS